MSVRVVPYRTGGWEVDIRVVLPDGSRRRERKKLALPSKSGARRWAEARERTLLTHRPADAPKPRKEVPTLQEFAERFLDGYARANQHKRVASRQRKRSFGSIWFRSSEPNVWMPSAMRTCNGSRPD